MRFPLKDQSDLGFQLFATQATKVHHQMTKQTALFGFMQKRLTNFTSSELNKV